MLDKKGKAVVSVATLYAAINVLGGLAYEDYDCFSNVYTGANQQVPLIEEEYYMKIEHLYNNPIVEVLMPAAYFQFKSDYDIFLEKYRKEHHEIIKEHE